MAYECIGAYLRTGVRLVECCIVRGGGEGGTTHKVREDDDFDETRRGHCYKNPMWVVRDGGRVRGCI